MTSQAQQLVSKLSRDLLDYFIGSDSELYGFSVLLNGAEFMKYSTKQLNVFKREIIQR